MTKKVRIENADTSPYGLTVELWERGATPAEDKMVEQHHLPAPTQVVEAYVHSGRYIVVREHTAPMVGT